MTRIGLISDTHGLLRPEALAFLHGSDHIVHAGDIGSPDIVERLGELAPLTVVRGNIDVAPWAMKIPGWADALVAGVALHVLHDIAELESRRAASARVVVCGHSHQPRIEHRDDHLIINPGSAGPRRFRLPIAVAELRIDDGVLTPRIVELPV
ncbi:MAG: metallophosphoesterase family protein [Burkholderiaceae bacterium]